MPQFLELLPQGSVPQSECRWLERLSCERDGRRRTKSLGQAFESGGEQITAMLRAQFPDRFVYPTSRVSDALTIHFSDPDKKQVVVEAGGSKNLVDLDRTTVNG